MNQSHLTRLLGHERDRPETQLLRTRKAKVLICLPVSPQRCGRLPHSACVDVLSAALGRALVSSARVRYLVTNKALLHRMYPVSVAVAVIRSVLRSPHLVRASFVVCTARGFAAYQYRSGLYLVH